MTGLNDISVQREVSDMLRGLLETAQHILDHPEEHGGPIDLFNLHSQSELQLLAMFGQVCYDRMKRWESPVSMFDETPIGAPYHDD